MVVDVLISYPSVSVIFKVTVLPETRPEMIGLVVAELFMDPPLAVQSQLHNGSVHETGVDGEPIW